MTQEIVINDCHGGFALSQKALEILHEEYGWAVTHFTEDGSLADPDARICENPERLQILDGQEWSLTVDAKRDDELRADPDLVEVVKDLGDDASGRHGAVKVVEVPDGVQWTIEEYDGNEWVAEEHRTWS